MTPRRLLNASAICLLLFVSTVAVDPVNTFVRLMSLAWPLLLLAAIVAWALNRRDTRKRGAS